VITRGWDNSVSITTAYGIYCLGIRDHFLVGGGGRYFRSVSNLSLGPIESPINWEQQPECEADHSPLVPRLINTWVCTSALLYIYMAMCVISYGDGQIACTCL
jgi:hypothetical protein